MREGDQAASGLEAVPGMGTWEGLQPMERERREGVLRGIRARIAEAGPRRAVADPARGRLFMPFAALEGYGEMLKDVEGDAAEAPSLPLGDLPQDGVHQEGVGEPRVHAGAPANHLGVEPVAGVEDRPI